MQVESIFLLRRRFAVPILSSGLLFAALVGCHRPPSPDVMATVNGKEILRSEVEKYYKANLGDNPQEPSPEQANIVRLGVLRNLIDDEIIQQRAAKLNLTATDEDVNAKLTEMKTPYTQEQFDKQLQQRGITLDDLKREIRHSLTQNKLLNKEIESKINITDGDINSYYKAHKADFNFIEPRYQLAQVVASAEPAAQPGSMQSKAITACAVARISAQSRFSSQIMPTTPPMAATWDLSTSRHCAVILRHSTPYPSSSRARSLTSCLCMTALAQAVTSVPTPFISSLHGSLPDSAS